MPIFYFARPSLILRCIFPEEKRLNTFCKSIIKLLYEKAVLLDKLIAVHKSMFEDDLLSAEAVQLSKLNS